MNFILFKNKFIWVVAGAFILCPIFGNSNSISVNQLTPASTAKLNFGEEISISFSYTISEPDGARIYIRPMTEGNLTPNYSASGSPVYSGEGNATATFTITSGKAKIDQLRLQVYNSTRSELLFEFYFPVNYNFSDAVADRRISERAISPNLRRSIQEMQSEQNDQAQSDENNLEQPQNQPVTKKILPNGSVEITYPNGRIKRLFEGGFEIYNPETEQSQTYLYSTAARPPVPPSLPDDAELIWMKSHSENLLNIIKSLVNNDPESIENYLQYEGDQDIYNQILLREETISYMVQP